MTPENPPLALEAKVLLDRSRMWLSDAMDAWSDGAADKVLALAPLGVELAAKAMLWHTNPTLLVPLDRQHEHSLIELATKPGLVGEKLRTVGLTEALNRAVAIASKDPEVDQRRRRIADCRNGVIHVGMADVNVSRHVLTDCIRLLAWILDHLGAAEQDFFGSHMNDCRALLDQSRTETQRAVLARLSKHRKRYERLMQSLDDEVAAATVEALERAAMASGPIGEDIPDFIPAQHECPACKRTGAVYGIASVEADADAEYEDGGEIVYYGYWVVTRPPAHGADVVRRRRGNGAPSAEDRGSRLDHDDSAVPPPTLGNCIR